MNGIAEKMKLTRQTEVRRLNHFFMFNLQYYYYSWKRNVSILLKNGFDNYLDWLPSTINESCTIF